MVTENRILSVQIFFVSAYLSCWFSVILNYFAEIESIDYIGISVLGATTLILTAFVILVHKYLSRWLGGIAILINILLLVLFASSIVSESFIFWLLLIFAVMQGLLLGTLLSRSQYTQDSKSNLVFLMLGCLTGAFVQYLPFPPLENNGSKTTFFSFWSNIFLVAAIVIFLVIMAVLEVIYKNEKNVIKKEATQNAGFSGITKYVAITMTIIYFYIELIYFFWSVVLIHDNQSFIKSLTFSLTIICILIFRVFSKNILKKISDIGWLFSLSIILSVSLGMFYTFSFTPLFIIGFGFSIAYLLFINNQLFHFITDNICLCYLLIFGAVTIVISGAFIQNHIEFIRSINMPKDVILLSARQAIVKEMASFAGIAVILSGYLFLKRRSILIRSN